MGSTARLKPALYYRVSVEGLPATEFQNVSGLNVDRGPKYDGMMVLRNSLNPLSAEWSAWLAESGQGSDSPGCTVKVDILSDQKQQPTAIWNVTGVCPVKWKPSGGDVPVAESIELRYTRMERIK